ncbi:MAG TPA: lipocalin family protein [Burkholderiaceae bacterium]|nr:lipocalin family protein [Burkholderiaceae bacterium]
MTVVRLVLSLCSLWMAASVGAQEAGSGLPSDAKAPLPTVAHVDLVRYSGRWHEIARYPHRFQAHCASQAMATYSLRATGPGKPPEIKILNQCVDARGQLDQAAGVARVVDGSGGAKLKVSFLPAWLRWIGLGWGNYWIIDLAPDYRYAIVGEPTRRYLWILSRRPTLAVDDRVKIEAKLMHLGYDPGSLIHTALPTTTNLGD